MTDYITFEELKRIKELYDHRPTETYKPPELLSEDEKTGQQWKLYHIKNKYNNKYYKVMKKIKNNKNNRMKETIKKRMNRDKKALNNL